MSVPVILVGKVRDPLLQTANKIILHIFRGLMRHSFVSLVTNIAKLSLFTSIGLAFSKQIRDFVLGCFQFLGQIVEDSVGELLDIIIILHASILYQGTEIGHLENLI